MKIAVTGTTGLIGTRFVELLNNTFEIMQLTLSSGVDITDKNSFKEKLKLDLPDFIVHIAAKTDVDSCENNKAEDTDKLKNEGSLVGDSLDFSRLDSKNWNGQASAFAINVFGTKNIAEIALEINVPLMYVSTDFVFFGDQEYYDEKSAPKPVNWYGMTKYWGEEIVRSQNDKNIIARLSFPYGYKSQVKKDFVWMLVGLLEKGEKLSLVDDQIVTPTFIDDAVLGIKFLIEKRIPGTFHVTGDSFVSPYDAGVLVAKTFGYDMGNFKKISNEEYYKGRARRPFHVRMKNDKLEKLGFKTKTFQEGLRLIIGNS